MASLQAGYGERVITPALGSELTGFGWYLDRRAESIHDDLKVRVLAVSQGDSLLLLASCDLLGLTVEYSDRARDRIAAAHGLPRENVLLACTHTHTGPAAQPLPGVAEQDDSYLAALLPWLEAACAEAVADLADAELSCAAETVEPIGSNRRTGSFAPIDPVLKLAVLRRDSAPIYLLNYACHPVTLMAAPCVSADWPGALAQRLETEGIRPVVFQGFCGDLNPVAVLNPGPRSAEEFELAGHLLAERALRAARRAEPAADTTLAAEETRIDLLLRVLSDDEIGEERGYWDRPEYGEAMHRYLAKWERDALASRQRLADSPCVPAVPLQALRLGPQLLLGLPGEIFCEYGLRLREGRPLLMTCGCSGGNVGYFCTREAYASRDDYAAYLAPLIYAGFAFQPELEDLVLDRAAALLRQLG